MIPWHMDRPAWVVRVVSTFPRPVMGVIRPKHGDRCDWCGGYFPAGERKAFGKKFCTKSCKDCAATYRRRGVCAPRNIKLARMWRGA